MTGISCVSWREWRRNTNQAYRARSVTVLGNVCYYHADLAKHPGPVDGPEAHRAGFTRGVDDAAVQVEGAQGAAGRPDGIDLGVGRGIVVEGDAVGPGAEKEAEETIHGKGESISCLFKVSSILWKIHQLQFS